MPLPRQHTRVRAFCGGPGSGKPGPCPDPAKAAAKVQSAGRRLEQAKARLAKLPIGSRQTAKAAAALHQAAAAHEQAKQAHGRVQELLAKHKAAVEAPKQPTASKPIPSTPTAKPAKAPAAKKAALPPRPAGTVPTTLPVAQRPYKYPGVTTLDNASLDEKVPVQHLDPKQLHATQDWLAPSKRDRIKGELRADKPILAVRHAGKTYIEEGHHRAAHALATGQKVPARVIELTPGGYRPAPAQHSERRARLPATLFSETAVNSPAFPRAPVDNRPAFAAGSGTPVRPIHQRSGFPAAPTRVPDPDPPSRFDEDGPAVPKLAQVHNVEVFASGTHRGEEYSDQDLDEMVRNFRRLSSPRLPVRLLTPTLAVGHEEEGEQPLWENTGYPAAGVVTNLWRDGHKLMADFGDVPPPVAKAINSRALRKVSAEVYTDFQDDHGRGYGMAIRRVALLGSEIPQIKSLADLPYATYADRRHGKVVRFFHEMPARPRKSVRAALARISRRRAFAEVRKLHQHFDRFSEGYRRLGTTKAQLTRAYLCERRRTGLTAAAFLRPNH